MAADSAVALVVPNFFQTLIEQAPDAMIFADREGKIRLWNSRAQAIFGYAASDAIGRNLDLIIPQHLRAAHWRGYQQAMLTGHTRLGGRPMVTRATHQDGSKLYVELAFGLLRDEQQGVLGAIATGRVASKPPSTRPSDP
jgi:PAS domain S-box-containing protein